MICYDVTMQERKRVVIRCACDYVIAFNADGVPTAEFLESYMNVDTAKRIVAIKRTVGAYRAMLNRGDLEKEEHDCLVAELDAEAKRIRSQVSVLLKADSDGPAQGPSAPQGRTPKG